MSIEDNTLFEAWHRTRMSLRLLIVVCIILVGFACWMFVSNRGLRQDNRELKNQNKELHIANDLLHTENKSLQDAVTIRDNRIRESTVIYDSLKTTLENLNNKKIVTVNENIHTISTLNLDGQIKLLAGFIADTDSAR